MLAALGLAAAVGLYFALRPPRWMGLLESGKLALPAGLLALGLAVGLFLLRSVDPERGLPVYERLSPLLIFLLLASVQTSLYLLAAARGVHILELSREGKEARSPWLIFVLALLVLLLVVAVTRLGVTPDPAYWGEPGIAIQGWQFASALILGGGVFLARRTLPQKTALIPVLIYLAALALWLSVPNDVLKNGFYVTIGPPAEQPYPFSDSYYYDSMAQSLFIGQPYRGEIPTRPLYITLLAFLHLIFGQRYDLILAGQTLVLGFIPVIFYWLGERLHSRAAGVTAAFFFIFRELTSILVSSETRTSNSRMLLVDLPTLMLVLLACLLALRWLERRDSRSALAAGGGFGLLLLLRTQSFLILPITLLIAALTLRPPGRFLRSSACFLLGTALAVAPWLLHNYLLTGQVTFDAAFQYKVIASQYAYTGNLDINNFEFEGKGVGQVLLQFLLKDPGFVLGFIANHFLAGWIGGLLALPLIEPFNGLFAPINLYWTQWKGHLEWYNLTLVIVYLGMIALGLAASWRRWRWAGMLPLGFSLGYALATAVGRFSGWRYDMPADWMPYFYCAVGFAELLRLGGVFFGLGEGEKVAEAPPADQIVRRGSLLPLGSLFVLLGALPWIATLFAAPQFTDGSPKALLPRLAQISGAPSQAEMEGFMQGAGAVVMDGRLLYPRFFSRDRGLTSATESPAYAPRGFARQGFLLLNQKLTHALFPTRGPLDFPQASEVLLLGCQREGYVEAQVVAFPESSLLYSSGELAPCD